MHFHCPVDIHPWYCPFADNTDGENVRNLDWFMHGGTYFCMPQHYTLQGYGPLAFLLTIKFIIMMIAKCIWLFLCMKGIKHSYLPHLKKRLVILPSYHAPLWGFLKQVKAGWCVWLVRCTTEEWIYHVINLNMKSAVHVFHISIISMFLQQANIKSSD